MIQQTTRRVFFSKCLSTHFAILFIFRMFHASLILQKKIAVEIFLLNLQFCLELVFAWELQYFQALSQVLYLLQAI